MRWFPTEKYQRHPRAWDTSCAKRRVRERVFAASMADVFEDHPALIDPRADLFSTIRLTSNLDWLLLTKRPENIAAMLPPDWGEGYPNVCMLTTIEDNRVRDERLFHLTAVPAIARGLSCEPMIAPIDLDGRLAGIDWVIVGGESGAKARPMELPWARRVVDAARQAGCAVHVKQLGSVWANRSGLRREDPNGGDIARFTTDLQIRECPAIGAAA
jgi:protein gp37